VHLSGNYRDIEDLLAERGIKVVSGGISFQPPGQCGIVQVMIKEINSIDSAYTDPSVLC
jgi:hypothetical protein